MATSRQQVYSVLVAALVVGVVAAAGFTGVISASQFTQPNYDRSTPGISFVSFCTVDSTSELTEDTVSPSLTTLEYNGVEKNWQVKYTLSTGVSVDYIVLKGGSVKGNGNSQAYLLRVNDPVSPVSVFGGMDDGPYETITANYPQDFNGDNSCLAGDSGVKFEYEGGTLVVEEDSDE